jgi:hypothetical protein
MLRAPLKTHFVMKSSEKIKVEAEGKIFHKHSHSYDEERFWLTTKRLIFAAICNKNEFLEVPLSN